MTDRSPTRLESGRHCQAAEATAGFAALEI